MSPSRNADDGLNENGSPSEKGENISLKKTYDCHICGAKLSRTSHLQRHLQRHSDDPQERFKCNQCSKIFGRRDVFQRHQRSLHGSEQPSQPGSRRKSCLRCVRYKQKCNRQHPCSICKEKCVRCEYNTTKSLAPSHSQERSQEKLVTGSSIANDLSMASRQSHCRPDSSMSSLLQEARIQVTESLSAPPDAIPASSYDTLPSESMNLGTPGEYRSSIDLDRQTAITGPCEQHEIVSNEFIQYEHPSFQGDAMVIPDISNPFDLGILDSSTFRASKMDWLGVETDFSDGHTLPSLDLAIDGLSTSGEVSRMHEDLMTREDHSHIAASSVSAQPDSMDMDQTVGSSFDKEIQSTWPHVLDRGGNEMWPFDYTSNKGFRKIKLPPLRQVLEDTIGHRPAIEQNTLKDLIKVLSAPHIPSLNDSPALEVLPAVGFLTNLLKIYFAEFHPVLPVIHVPTWKIEKCPTALLAALACIGATYSTAAGSQDVATLLAEITQRALFWMGQADSTVFRNPAYISAMCFHQIHSLGSGNRRLYELADASRGLLVTCLRGLGVLSSEANAKDESQLELQNLRNCNWDELEQAWLRWRDKELEKRVAWAVFEFDCTLSTMTSKRAAFKIAELPQRMPCSESLWEAHSARAWSSMVSFTTGPRGGYPTYELLRGILAHKKIPCSVPAWVKRLCAQAVGRLLWDLKEIEDASSPSLLGFPGLAHSHNSTRQSLLKSLSLLHDLLSNPTNTAELVNMNIACLATHYIHLHSGNEALDLITFILRISGRESSPELSHDLTRAKDHLRATFALNPASTRRSVSHAASIITIAQECTIFTPCETMRVFNGYAFLLAFNKFFPFSQVDNSPVAQAPVKLDELPWKRSLQAVSHLEKWIEHGGKASLGPVDDVCGAGNFDDLEEMALKAMQELRVWGLARKFHRILQNFSQKVDNCGL